MKKILIASLITMAAATAHASCHLTSRSSYSIINNWAEATCADSKGNPYILYTTWWDWVSRVCGL